ncbi:MAG: low molecular weight phosphotyrosine protein phosphatase [Bacteroidetes bacterium]|nr:low molecular weight phosphotyrosine protein phosphatase [Bacteroidota bacterium]
MKILMVCLGNICRSPLAEGILKEKFKQNGIKGTVDSAGTAAYHAGEKPDPRSIEVARKYGIDIKSQTARKFRIEDFDNFDKIFVMDGENFDNIKLVARNNNDIQKVDLILNQAFPDKNLHVPDPYYGGKDGFENVYNMLDNACDVIVEKIKNNNLL